MTKYALLDYDGFVCKSFYAALARDGSIEEAYEVLKDLEYCAHSKAVDYFGTKDIKIVKVMSGHSCKKDIYLSYKEHRNKDEFLGVYRTLVKEWENDILIVPQLEADDVLVMMYEQHPEDSIVFSDDKDLRYYCPLYCKLNVTEDINFNSYYINNQLEQMLVGDKEDGIAGVPKVGQKTAEKLLDLNGYDIKSVVKIYKDKDISRDECMKNLFLVIPICKQYTDDYHYGFTDTDTINNILGRFRYINNIIKEVYNEG